MPKRPDLVGLGPKRKHLEVKFTTEGHYAPMKPVWHIEGASRSDLRLIRDLNARDLGQVCAPDYFVDGFSYILATPFRTEEDIVEQRKAIAELRDDGRRKTIADVIERMYELESVYDAMHGRVDECDECFCLCESISRKLSVLNHYINIIDSLDSLTEGTKSQPMRDLRQYVREIRDSDEMAFVPITVQRGMNKRKLTFELTYDAGGGMHTIKAVNVERGRGIPALDILRHFGNRIRAPIIRMNSIRRHVNNALDALIRKNWPSMVKTVSLLPDLEFYRAAGIYEDKIAKVEGDVVFPEFTREGTEIDNLGHPIILLSGNPVVRNDYHMDGQNVMLITGANNSGKTFYSKSVGLAHLLTQRGMSVPATSAHMRIADGVYTHFVDQDDPLTGQGRYKFELTRMAEILDTCSRDSLVIVDEPCGGTEPEQGQVQSSYFLEALTDAGVQTIFTTHYHGLAKMTAENSRIKNMHPHTEKRNGQLVYSHRMVEGAAGTSMALELAKSLNLGREELIEKARRIRENNKIINDSRTGYTTRNSR